MKKKVSDHTDNGNSEDGIPAFHGKLFDLIRKNSLTYFGICGIIIAGLSGFRLLVIMLDLSLSQILEPVIVSYNQYVGTPFHALLGGILSAINIQISQIWSDIVLFWIFLNGIAWRGVIVPLSISFSSALVPLNKLVVSKFGEESLVRTVASYVNAIFQLLYLPCRLFLLVILAPLVSLILLIFNHVHMLAVVAPAFGPGPYWIPLGLRISRKRFSNRVLSEHEHKYANSIGYLFNYRKVLAVNVLSAFLGVSSWVFANWIFEHFV